MRSISGVVSELAMFAISLSWTVSDTWPFRGTRGAAATPLTGRSTSLPSEGTLAQLRLFVDDVQCVNTVLASI